MFDAYVTMNGQLCFDERGTYRDAHIDDADVRVLVEQARAGLYDLYVMQGVRSFVNNRGPLVVELGRQVGLDYEVGLLDMAYELPVYQFNVFGGPEVEDVFLSRPSTWWQLAGTNCFAMSSPPRAARTLACAPPWSGWASRPTRRSPLAMAKTTSRCSTRWGRASPWATRGMSSKDRATHITTDVDDDGIWNACVELGII